MDSSGHHLIGLRTEKPEKAKTHKARSEGLGSRANNVCHNCPLSIPS